VSKTVAISPRARGLLTWTASLFLLVVATAVLYEFRPQLDKAQVALVYLLVVLFGSAAGGRALGLALAALAFLLFDFLFLPPYYTFAITNPLDWLVLVAFLVTSVVAAQLLARADRRTADARDRTAEVERLAALGAESLSAGRAEDALAAICGVIRETLGVERCEVYAQEERVGAPALRLVASAGNGSAGPELADPNSLLTWVAGHGTSATERLDGTARVAPVSVVWPDPGDARVLVLPLRARNHAVGALRIVNGTGIILAADQRQFLTALAYYAALGVERLRLTAEARRADALREADKLKDALLAAVSHDLRTPLTTIKALAHRIGESGAAPNDERVESIEEEADRLARVVSDLLELSRITSGAARFHPELNTAEELLGAVLQRVSGVLHGRRVLVTEPDDTELLVGRFDLVHTLRALGNLVENALKYSDRASAVEIAVRRDNGMLLFSVSDRGPGIPEAERERIFEPFYRPPGVPPDTGGSGLGLTIARGIADAQGGALRFRPREGGGSVFELLLPAVEHTPV
jgi:two-component system sensor histidine kinase KdpD